MLGAITAGASAASGASDYLSSYDKQKDENRRATNQRAYLAALNGQNANAYTFLKARGGGAPANVLPLAGVSDGGWTDGWASEPAREDAKAKARSLAPKYETGVLPDPDGRTTVGGIDPITGRPTSQVPLAANSATVVLVLAALALGAWVLMKREA